MSKEFYDVGRRDPTVGDRLRVDDTEYRVADRCPCGTDAMHIRWFLETEGDLDDVHFAQEGVLAKEWDEKGAEAWWFGLRIGASDLRIGKQRLTERLRANKKTPPKRLSYEGRSYHLSGVVDAPDDVADDSIPMAVWEYLDKDEVESVLVETSTKGDLIAYHGWYSNPEDIRIA